MNPINLPTPPAFFAWQPAAWLRVTGTDAATFLQGQFTNDLRDMRAGGAVYGLWLSVKGKVVADSFVLRGQGEEFWLGSYFSAAEVIRERLEAFIIADDVSIEDQTTGWRGFSVWGVPASELRVPGALVFPGRRGREASVECVLPLERMAVMETILREAPRLAVEEVSRRRIEAAIPAVPMDIGPADLPNEAGLEADAISFTKGCYLGQEVMARLKSMGQVRRRLLRVRGASATPPLPAALHVGERAVGELRSAVREGAHFHGLAMISLLNLAGASQLALTPGGDPSVTLSESS